MRHLFVAGRPVVTDGVLGGVDLAAGPPDTRRPGDAALGLSVAGETDLAVMLAGLRVLRRPGPTCSCRSTTDDVRRGRSTTGRDPLGDGVEALIAEAEGVTAIATVERARAEGWAFDFEAAWLTLEVHSALEAVGLTAAVSAALTAEGIACNVVAGFHHDHLLVPADRAADAIACLEALRSDRSRLTAAEPLGSSLAFNRLRGARPGDRCVVSWLKARLDPCPSPSRGPLRLRGHSASNCAGSEPPSPAGG